MSTPEPIEPGRSKPEAVSLVERLVARTGISINEAIEAVYRASKDPRWMHRAMGPTLADELVSEHLTKVLAERAASVKQGGGS